ncbi:helix-turn-helix transcriptional regulator [Nocardiopsis sp. CT-R113]|uniref:Helix-turn-helix transcriptional regulator n=1 Tax=Nocardiopsis codii TaxID=3065942 RepID=A0ABU7KG83_9ACTN|nr:helix-turn-helix transcriptional regulator [Nocardiopsis sp. CT-R113]MEE2041251.1 helix-turn-helix transcriptional regulator [Nocardiopsis sp. CT-R113]
MINGNTLVALRETLGYTRAHVARTAGISPQHYGQIERGQRGRRPSRRVLYGISTALGVKPAAIIRDAA